MSVLAGKVALVTGAGRPRGMGWAAALRLAEAGADVIVTSYCATSRQKKLDLGEFTPFFPAPRPADDVLAALGTLAGEIEAMGRRALPLTLDVSDREEVFSAVRRGADALGGLDIVFNNAGVAYGAGPFLDMTEDQWRRTLDVNLMGIVNMCQAAIPEMRKRGGGSIINNSSDAGLRGQPGLSGYSASKFAVIGLTQSLASEFGSDGIRVNAVCPGAIHTDMGDLEYAFTAVQLGVEMDAAIAHMCSKIPMGRLGTAEEVADAVVFLASPQSRYITGAALPVTGGQQP
jgi:NAD(P)-dependent dehydrogenase (short-subunit alcohol dehydrogenase family)